MSRIVEHRRTYTYEEKLAAVRAHLEDGRSVEDAMNEAGVESKSAFFRWCVDYRQEGPESLRPKKRGRPAKNK